MKRWRSRPCADAARTGSGWSAGWGGTESVGEARAALCIEACVVTRNRLRAHSQIRQNRPILSGTPLRVPQNRGRKALGGGTAFVHHAS